MRYCLASVGFPANHLPGGWEPLGVDGDTVLVARPLPGKVLVFFLKEVGHLRGSKVGRLHATRLLLKNKLLQICILCFGI